MDIGGNIKTLNRVSFLYRRESMKKRVRKARLLAMKNVPVVEVKEEVKPKRRASKKKEA